MRLLLVGSESRYAIERAYVRHLSELQGVSFVELFPAQNIFLEYYNKSLLHKMFYRAGVSGILEHVNNCLKAKIDESRPDLVFVFKGMEVFPETLKWVRERKIKLVNYNPDNPFIFSGRGSGNENIRPAIPLYDLHYTYDHSVKERIEREFSVPARILPFGFDISSDVYQTAVDQDEIVRTCFLGNPDRHRASFISKLAEEGVEIDVYGRGWRKYIDHQKITVYTEVYEQEFWKTLRRYRIQLNLMRPHNPSSHNMRTFEVPAVGGIQLAPATPDHAFYFTPESEIFLYSDIKNCKFQITRLLTLSNTESDKIRSASRNRCIEAGHSYRNRAEQVATDFDSLLND